MVIRPKVIEFLDRVVNQYALQVFVELNVALNFVCRNRK